MKIMLFTFLGLFIWGVIYMSRDNTKKERKQLYRNIYKLSKPDYLEEYKDKFYKNFNNPESYLQTAIMKQIVNETRGFLNIINSKRAEREKTKSNTAQLEKEKNITTEIQNMFAENTCPAIIYERIKDLYYPKDMSHIEQYFKTFYGNYTRELDEYFSKLMRDYEYYGNKVYSQSIETQGLGFNLYTNSARHVATYAVMDKIERDRQYKQGMQNQRNEHDSWMNIAMKTGAESIYKYVQGYYKDLENKVISICK